MEKLGIYGGSFNPIHLGHIALVEQARVLLDLDKVLLIPTASSPFKQEEAVLSGEKRLELCRLAVRKYPGLEVSDLEIKRGGVSYTYQTLEQLAAPNRALFLIVGGDMFLTIDRWKNAMWIAQTTMVCGAARTEGQLPLLKEKAAYLEACGFRCIVLDKPVIEISSTQVRERIRAGKDTSGLLDPEVGELIRDKGYYR